MTVDQFLYVVPWFQLISFTSAVVPNFLFISLSVLIIAFLRFCYNRMGTTIYTCNQLDVGMNMKSHFSATLFFCLFLI